MHTVFLSLFYPEYPFSFRGISWWSSNSSFKASDPVVKRSKKIFDLNLFYFISFEVLKIRCFDVKKLLYFGSSKKIHPLLSPPGYRPTRIYVHQKRLASGYKPWAYIWDQMRSWQDIRRSYDATTTSWNYIAIIALWELSSYIKT